MILDLFAGPGGWSEGLRMIGLEDVGVELDATACTTRAAAGHPTIRADVERLPIVGRVEGLIASPPCQDFSVAGKKAGRLADRGRLIDLVPAIVADLRPEWIACEQVPPCLPIWREHAAHYERCGYATWTGVLNSADYGVPQTRRRAYLLASRMVNEVGPPRPTHSNVEDDWLLEWVTMADTLAWTDETVAERLHNQTGDLDGRWCFDRPSTTVAGRGLVQHPGATANRFNGATKSRNDGLTITVAEALVLQGFPDDYPVASRPAERYAQSALPGFDPTPEREVLGRRFEQIGNAVCPPMAAQTVASLLEPADR